MIEGDGGALATGDVVEVGTWLGETLVEAFGAVSGDDHQCLAVDSARGEYWLVAMQVESREPLRARVHLSDVTFPVSTYRDALVRSVVHWCANATFAVQSVVASLVVERPVGVELDTCLRHLQDATDRFASGIHMLRMSDVAALSLSRVTTEQLVEATLARVDARHGPVRVDVGDRDIVVEIDAVRVVEALAAILESGGRSASPTMAIARVDRAMTITIAHVAPTRNRVGTLLDLTGAGRFEMQARLARAREIIVLHGGNVSSARHVDDRLVIELYLPVISES